MKFNAKRVKALAMSAVFLCSAVFDSGLIVANATPVTSQMKGNKIKVGNTYQFGCIKDNDGFVNLTKDGTSWAGSLWVHNGPDGAEVAYCSALGKAAPDNRGYALVEMDGNAEALNEKLGNVPEEKRIAVFNALGRFMYPAKAKAGDIMFYAPVYNTRYAAGQTLPSGFKAIGGSVNLNQAWDDCRWMQTFLTVYTCTSSFTGSAEFKGSVSNFSPISEDEYRGLSQGVVWELGDLVFTSTMGSPVTRYVIAHDLARIERDLNLKEVSLAARESREPKVFEHLHPHAFRHTFATRCFEKGLLPEVVQSIMGHSSYETTLSYTHIMEDIMRKEVGKAGDFL